MQLSDRHIRPVAADDLESVLRVYRQCEDFLALGPQPIASMRMVLADMEASRASGGDFCGVHAATGEMIGVVDSVPRGFEGRAEQAFISLLMIAAPHRNRGIGTDTLRIVEERLRKDAAVSACLTAVQTNNPAALRFWQRNGYRIVGDAEAQADGTTVYRMRKSFVADCVGQ